MDVSLVVSNAGYSQCGPFKEVPIHLHKRMIDVNVIPCVILPKLLLPQMLKRVNRSGMIWVSSINAVGPTAGHVTYCGTKIFEASLGQSLNHELRDKIDCLSHAPGITQTKMVGNYKENFICISPTKCAREALKMLGADSFTAGSFKHQYSTYFMYHLQRLHPSNFNSTWFGKANRVWNKVSSTHE